MSGCPPFFYGTTFMALGVLRLSAGIMTVKLIASIVLLVPLVRLYGLMGGVMAVAFHGVVLLPFLYWIGRKHGINDLRHEGLVLVGWPVGYALGVAFVWLAGVLIGIQV